MIRKWAWVAALLVVLTLALPAAAYADDKAPVSCSVTLAVTDVGSIVVKGSEVRTTGEKTAGQLDCDFNALDGVISTSHNSEVKVKPDGSFSGELEGTFEVATSGGTVKGKIEAKISGAVVGVAPTPPFPPGTLIYRVIDNGKWEMESAALEGKGKFDITLVGIVGVPASWGGLQGSGSLGGKVEIAGSD